MALENLLGIVDSMTDEIAEAAPRNYQRWTAFMEPEAWPTEVEELRSWIVSRIEWLDAQLILEGQQIPGDLDQDGALNITDAVGLLRTLFRPSGPALPCGSGDLDDPANQRLLDLNGDRRIDLADANHVLNYLFRSGPAPVLGVQCIEIAGCLSVCSSR